MHFKLWKGRGVLIRYKEKLRLFRKNDKKDVIGGNPYDKLVAEHVLGKQKSNESSA